MSIHRLTIEGFLPARLNELLGHWSRGWRLKRRDRDIIALAARLQRIPVATGKRRVSLTIILAPRQRAADPDAFWKSTNDALVACGLLLDDNRQHCELGTVAFQRGTQMATEIVLEDVG